MVKDKNNKVTTQKDLRQRAQELLNQKPDVIKEVQKEDLPELIEELRIHQTELEIQNEQLRQTQQELELTRDRYQDLYDFAPVGYFTLNENSEILDVNLKGASLLGIERGNLKNQLFSKFIPDKEILKFHEYKKDVLQSETQQSCELSIQQKNGTEKYCHFNSIALYNSQGALNIRIAVTDITPKKHAENLLKASEEKFRSIAENAGILIGIIQDMKFQYVNPYAEQVFGYTPEEIMSMDFSQLIHPDHSKMVLENAKKRLKGLEIPSNYEIKVITKSGEIRWLNLFLSSVNLYGKPTIIGSGIDITREKKLLSELEAERSQLNTIFENAPEGIVVADEESRIVSLNPMAEELFSRPAPLGEHFKTHADMQICYSDGTPFKPRDLPLTRSALDGISFNSLEMGIKLPDGTFRNILVNTAPIKDDAGKLKGAVGIFQDITKQKKIEKELEKSHERLEEKVALRTQELAEKNQELQDQILVRVEKERELENILKKLRQSNRDLQDFAFMASHDLQEPLRKIQSFGERLSDKYKDALDERGQDYLQRMQNASIRMRSLIRALLEYSRVSTHAKPFSKVNLSEAVKEAIDHWEERFEETGGQIDFDNLPQIDGEPLQLVQLFQNLIGNSLKFHKENVPPVIKIWHEIFYPDEKKEQDNAQIKIYIEDNGIGFNSNSAEKLFTPFQTIHAAKKYEGSGMGLAICRRIVERHNGTIKAEGHPQKGAKFIITFPVEQKLGGKESNE